MSEELHQQELNDNNNNAATELPGVNLTPKALDAVRKMIAKEGLGSDQGLRISVVGGGCSGFQYSLGFDGRKEGDILTVLDGVNVFGSQYFATDLEVEARQKSIADTVATQIATQLAAWFRQQAAKQTG